MPIPILNAERGMRNAECGMRSAERAKHSHAKMQRPVCSRALTDRPSRKATGGEEKRSSSWRPWPCLCASARRQALGERWRAGGRETTRNAELGMRNEKREKRTSRDEYARWSESWIPGLCSVAACLPRFALKVYWQFLATLACLSER